ncbi:Hypothetical protein BN2458_PEG1740 [Helicobacter typhlonius]|uniref:Uncharacterized protein n=1 Tax=Helicobacter typhlonius TaxID=76936 RepID=A0A0S4PWB1_9HELI|nr:Hypothetical protein BN2458_PEG1740 [Helicobacter typhlonius]
MQKYYQIKTLRFDFLKRLPSKIFARTFLKFVFYKIET